MVQRHIAWILLVTIGTLVLAACANGSQQLTELSAEMSKGGINLPVLESLDQMAPMPNRDASSITLEMLNFDPLAASTEGVDNKKGQVSLDPTVDGSYKWVIYGLAGFDAGQDIIPESYDVQKDKLCWVAAANYGSGLWEFERAAFPGTFVLDPGSDYVSPAGNFFVAIIAVDIPVTATSISVTASNTPTNFPVAVLTVPGTIVEQYEVGFDASGSTPGEGDIVKATYDFGDSTPPVETADKDEVVNHTYSSAGDFQVALTVENSSGYQHTTEQNVTVDPAVTDLLIVYNSDMPEDLDLADYYSSPQTGRAIHPGYRLGLPLGPNAAQTISRELYGTDIRDPIIAFIDDPVNAQLKSNIKYLLMMKGVPYRIPGTDGNNHDLSTNACVDSELCMLRNGDAYRLEGPVWSGANYQDFLAKSGFWEAGNVSFQPDTFPLTDLNGDHWTLNYLVGRITAYTYEDCKLMIDRSLAADTSGTGWIILDTKTGSNIYETMHDPVWPNSENDWDSGYELLTAASMNVFGELTNDRVTWDYAPLPAGAAGNILGYCSWGVHSGFTNLYILDSLGFTYVPGACFMSYESVNGVTMRDSNPADPREGHPSQGQIADFIYMGGTVAIGNVFEPWTDGVGDERWVFDRYLHHGDRWIEAAYKGLYYVSWQEVVIGDPLCRVVAP